TPRFSQTAKRLWLLYAAITFTQIVLLTFGDMNLFQSIAHSLTTMSTGGFGTEATSLNNFSIYSQWVVILFMVVAGSSFTLLYRGLRRPRAFFESAEFRTYIAIAIGAIIVVVGGLIATGSGWSEETIRDGTFTSISIITTTGFGTADFALWVSGLQVFIVGLMFLGGMAGSTAGGVKTFRIGTLAKAAHADLRRLIHPRGVFVTRFGKKAVPDDIVESIQSFFLFYMFLFMTGTFLLAFIDSNSSTDLDLVTTATAVASALGNIGPGLADVGPTSNYAGIPGLGKWLLSFLMITGRLEVFPVLLLFTPDLWRK
ncbi:MAG: TrkH family potassium uptake protein, partial [Acidimicrobiia bacterium]|nr:TrkH family potassium uptake protein [Acidimicrobiia bacterium]